MPFIKKIHKASGTYLALVESKWENGKPRQHLIRYLGKEVEGKAVRRASTSEVKVTSIKRHLDVEIIDRLANELNLKQHIQPAALILSTLNYSKDHP